jgi:hypothetical protein
VTTPQKKKNGEYYVTLKSLVRMNGLFSSHNFLRRKTLKYESTNAMITQHSAVFSK